MVIAEENGYLFSPKTNCLRTIKEILSAAINLSIFILFVLLPSMNADSLMNGTQSGKTFIFLWLIALIAILSIVRFWINPEFAKFNFKVIDVFILTYFLYVLFRNSWNYLENSLLFFELSGLVILYFVLRQLSASLIPYMLIAIIVGGILQTMNGILQLYGFQKSHHELFKMTGSFFNPGPYSGYLSSVFPISFGFCLFNIKNNSIPIQEFVTRYFNKTHFIYNNKVKKKREGRTKISDFNTLKIICLISLISLCFVLSISCSRAAWLAVMASSLYLTSKKIQLFQFIRMHFYTPARMLFFLLLLTTTLIAFFVGLYQLKKNSANGRLLIWNISAKMIEERPFWGYGYDKFKSHYLDYQAEYFKENPGDERALVAGDSNYAFNELVQLTVENGLIGIIPHLAISLLFFRKLIGQYKQESVSKFIYTDTVQLRPTQTNIDGIISQQNLLIITNSMIISIVIFCLFSYPFQILPIKICLTVALSIVAGKVSLARMPKMNMKINPSKAIKSILSIGLLLLLGCSLIHVHRLKVAFTDWKNAFDQYNYSIYDESLINYKKAYPLLNTNGDYLTNYGKALSLALKHTDALRILNKASRYYPNTVVYIALGESYTKLGLTNQAEEAYLLAWHMNPSRFYPKYLLAKLYAGSGNDEKAVTIAKELLKKDIKVESKAIQKIRSEMEKIVFDTLK